MTLGAGTLSNWPIAAQVSTTSSTKKPPRNRQIVAKPDEMATPEPR
jgi:hypothetical protein